MLESLSFEN